YVLLMDDDIPNGGIGAILYNGETSLKRVFYDEKGLRLEPANPEYEAINIRPDVFEEVRMLGRYVGHVNQTGIYKRPAA
ncbi:MAG: repressor LexA, partial [Rhodothermales bacterium]